MSISRSDKFFFVTVYFVQGAVAISSLALLHFQKDILQLSAGQLATFSALITLLAWSFKPIYGFISDVLPIGGYRRKPYLIITSLMTLLSYIYLSFFATDYYSTLIPLVLANIGLGFTDVLCDGLAVEKSDKDNVGKIQNMCWSSKFSAILVVSLLGGYMNEKLGIIASNTDSSEYLHGIKLMFLITSFLPLITLIQVIFLKENKVTALSTLAASINSTFKDVKAWVLQESFFKRNIYFFAPLLFIFIWRSLPTAGAPLSYFVINERGFNDSYLGLTASIGYIGHLIGALIYGKWVDNKPLRKVFFWTLLMSGLFSFLSLIIIRDWQPFTLYGLPVNYKSVNMVIDFFGGALFYLSFLPLLKLSAQICPKGREATLFALIASVMNLGLAMSSFLGGSIWTSVFNEDYGQISDYLIFIILCNFIILPCILLLPKKSNYGR